MKKLFFLTTLLLGFAATMFAQTLNVYKGDVTYAYKASSVGDMTFVTGSSLIINSCYYSLTSSDDMIDKITIDDSEVDDNTISVAYDGSSASVVVAGNIASLVDVTVSGGHVTIVQDSTLQQEVTYTLSGTSTNGSFTMDGEYKANFVLNDLTLTNPSGCAIDIEDGKAIGVSLVGTNTLTDCADGSHNATLYINGHPTFSGSGSLTLTGLTKHAFTSDEYCVVSGGTITVSSAVTDGFHINERFEMTGGTLNITASGDGIDVGFRGENKGTKDEYERNGFAEFEGGTVTITTDGEATKGLKTDSTIVISGATLDITTTGDAYYDTDDADITSSSAVKGGGELQITSGSLTATSRGSGGKGINMDGDVTISGGKVVVTTTGEVFEYGSDDTKPQGIKTDANITVSGGEVYVASSSDSSTAFKAGTLFYINGGTLMGIGKKKITPASASTQGYARYSSVSVSAGQTVSYDGVSYTVPSYYSNSSAQIIVSTSGM